MEALRPNPTPSDLDVVIGMMGPIAPPEMCNGLTVPVVVFDQIYSFDRNALIKAIPKPEKSSMKEFGPAAEEVFDRIIQMADNAGTAFGDRALNYLAVRYQAIYAKAAEYFEQVGTVLLSLALHDVPRDRDLRGLKQRYDQLRRLRQRLLEWNMLWQSASSDRCLLPKRSMLSWHLLPRQSIVLWRQLHRRE